MNSEKGVASIRIMGQKIEDLPFGARERALAQLPLALDTERQNEIKNILARYPKAKIPYLESRVVEARENIQRVAKMRNECTQNINEYQALIHAQVGKRSYHEIEPEIDAIAARDDLGVDEKKAQIHDLKRGVSYHDVDALKAQIKQFEESIERADRTIQRENDSIAELRETIGKCQMRDMELKNVGVAKAAVG